MQSSETEVITETNSDSSEAEALAYSRSNRKLSQKARSASNMSSSNDSTERLAKSTPTKSSPNEKTKQAKKKAKITKMETESSEDTDQIPIEDVGESEESSVSKPTPAKKPRATKATTKSAGKSSTKKTADQLAPILREFFLKTKRPYIISEIVLMYKDEATKPVIINAMNILTDDGTVIKKEFGKTVAFLVSKTPSNLSSDEILDLNTKKDTLEQENTLLEESISTCSYELKKITEYPTNSDLISQIQSKQHEIEENDKRIVLFSEGKIKVEKSDMEKVEKDLSKYRRILKDRKQIVKDILDVLLDNSGLSKEELFEAIGIEG